jgi:hypothetical protein
MRPTTFEQAYSKPLGAGDNPNTSDLPRCVCTNDDTPGVVSVLSCWEPSYEELAEIIRTRKVWIGVMAHPSRPTQAPIWVLGSDPIASGLFKRIPEEDVKHLGDQAPIL